jgi:cyanate permease
LLQIHGPNRPAFFYSATTISGVFSGLIAYGVQLDLEGAHGWASWKWLFLIEGVIAIAIGLCNSAFLPSFPASYQRWACPRYFTTAEIKVALERSREHNGATVRLRTDQILASIKDPKTWLLALLAGCNSTILACTGAFLPTIIKEFGFPKVRAQLFTVIPYAVAFFAMIAIGYLSDRLRNKSYFIIASLSSCLVGTIILISSTGKAPGMIGTTLLVAGAYPASVLQIAWIQITFCGSTKRATSWGVAMIFGQGLSMSGAQIYRQPPRVFLGHGVLLGYITIGLISTVVARLLMGRENRRREAECREYAGRGEEHPGAAADLEDVCDKHIMFRYRL